MTFLFDFTEENLSDLVTRPVPLPEKGKFRNFTMQRRYWLSYDVINVHRPMWPEELIRRARSWCDHNERHIDQVFPGVVWSMHDWWQNKLGTDTGIPVPPPPWEV